ncbi:tandem-type lipoprotein [Enterococcus sp. DIV0242_7C1]|nr:MULTISPECIES: tandem-type lipoprotein [unclassified Enterococcus]MBO0469839.1 tandem-type lipoprotein [Enterococcus sp. DIV0242_7C1]
MKKLYLFIGGLIIMSGITGCQTKNKAEIEQSFDKVLAMYPTPNLEDFYDMEGYRDGEFDENDKGVWLLHSSMSISTSEDSGLATEGMLLRMNRNNRKAKGYYYTTTYWNDLSKPKGEKRYPVIYDNEGFRLLEDISDTKLKEKIMNFQFFVQYGNFKKLDSYENIRKMYNPEVPMYELEYQLTNEDQNVKALRERYDIPTEEAPILLLKGRGDLQGSSVGYKELEFTFDKKIDVFFDDSIDFQPLSQEDVINE